MSVPNMKPIGSHLRISPQKPPLRFATRLHQVAKEMGRQDSVCSRQLAELPQIPALQTLVRCTTLNFHNKPRRSYYNRFNIKNASIQLIEPSEYQAHHQEDKPSHPSPPKNQQAPINHQSTNQETGVPTASIRGSTTGHPSPTVEIMSTTPAESKLIRYKLPHLSINQKTGMPTASIKRVQIGHRSPITEIISTQTPAVIKTYKISIMPSVNQLVKRPECLPPQLRGSTTGPQVQPRNN